MIKPKIVIPVHGDKRAIRQQKRFTEELDCGVSQVLVVRDGDVVNVKSSHAEIVGEVPTDELGVDRKKVISLGSQLVKNRRRIAYNCSLFITAVLAEDWSVEDLQITSIDILEENDFAALADEIKADMLKAIPAEAVKVSYRSQAVKEYIAAKIRKRIFNATGIKPVTFIHFYKRSRDGEADFVAADTSVNCETAQILYDSDK